MDLQLEDKKALITGSTAGIGLAIARKLVQEGASVIINGRTQERVDEAIAKLRQDAQAAQSEILGAAADLSSAADVENVTRAHPDVDILVNNVGMFDPKPFAEISDDEWLDFYKLNVLSGVRLSRFYLPKMKERGWGRIVFISSESAVHILAEMIHYGVTKTAQVAVARGLAETTAQTGVTVNSVLPGPTRSEGIEDFISGMAQSQGISWDEIEKQFFETERPTSLSGRFIEPEVANLTAYVCSPLSSATNGAALRVDGGVVRAVL